MIATLLKPRWSDTFLPTIVCNITFKPPISYTYLNYQEHNVISHLYRTAKIREVGEIKMVPLVDSNHRPFASEARSPVHCAFLG